ncbi:MAG: response regulator [Chitinispirillaceae bacterium]|nr:response regulator [Chitinispirillaceae bacterium]
MVKKVLVADDDLDVHQLVYDILQISLKQVTIDRALTSQSFLQKINDAKNPYDLILFNIRMNKEDGANLLGTVERQFPGLMERIILLADSPEEKKDPLSKDVPCVSKPFCLDHFGEVIKKVCSA